VLERPRSRDQQIQALVGSHPDGTPGCSRQSTYTIVYERVRALRIVLQMFDVSRERVNDVDPGISGAGPDAARVIGEQRDYNIARQGSRLRGVVPKQSEPIGVAVPSGKTAIGDSDPQVAVRVLHDCLNEIAGEPVRRLPPISVPKKPVSVVAHQAIFGAEPDESLAVLQRTVDRALGQTIRSCEMLENGRERLGIGRGTRLLYGRQASDYDADL
jgi:hypothetical protein